MGNLDPRCASLGYLIACVSQSRTFCMLFVPGERALPAPRGVFVSHCCPLILFLALCSSGIALFGRRKDPRLCLGKSREVVTPQKNLDGNQRSWRGERESALLETVRQTACRCWGLEVASRRQVSNKGKPPQDKRSSRQKAGIMVKGVFSH